MDFHLAEINIATLMADDDSDEVAEFMDNLDAINALAETSPGFVWRLVGDGGNATDIKMWDDPRMILNISVWESVDSLKDYVYRSRHVEFFRRKREWFVPGTTQLALWWIPAGTTPSPEDGLAALKRLDTDGPSPDGFTFATVFPPPSERS